MFTWAKAVFGLVKLLRGILDYVQRNNLINEAQKSLIADLLMEQSNEIRRAQKARDDQRKRRTDGLPRGEVERFDRD